jgi:very-short-patch-repair endonuclease
MAQDTHNKAVTSNSPSKIRGGGAKATGALKTVPQDTASVSVRASQAVDAPALTGTPSYPRGGVSQNSKQVMNRPEMKAFRRDLRSHGTTTEGALWKMLKGKQIAGLQFRRQFSVGSHILDFYCPSLKLAIELDGDYHYHMEMPDRDWRRDGELQEKYGIKTLRFENKIVFNHPEAILEAINLELSARNS